MTAADDQPSTTTSGHRATDTHQSREQPARVLQLGRGRECESWLWGRSPMGPRRAFGIASWGCVPARPGRRSPGRPFWGGALLALLEQGGSLAREFELGFELPDPRSCSRELDVLAAAQPWALAQVDFLLGHPAIDRGLRDAEIARDRGG